MLGVEIEFGNNRIRLETSSYKPSKAETPARTPGFQVQMVARGGIEPPTQGFSTLSNRVKTIGFQAVVPADKNVAHNMCL